MAYGAHVQSRAVNSGAGTSADLAFLSNNTAGNTLVVAIRYNADPGASSVTDSAGNTYSLAGASDNGSWWTAVYYVPSCVVGANTVTILTTNSVIRRWIIHEYEGGSAVDNAAADADFGTTISGGDINVANNVTLIFVIATTADDATFTEVSPYTKRQEIERIASEDRVTSSSGTYSTQMTIGSADSWLGVSVAFYQVAADTTLTVSPAKLQWQAQALRFPVTISTTPARMQWQARACRPTTILAATPARMQWRASQSVIARGPFGAYVQSTGGALGDGPVQTLAFTNTVTQGNTLFVATRFGDNPGTITVTDTLGNTYTQISYSTGVLHFQCFYAVLCVASGANTVTITIENAPNIRAIIAEYEGRAAYHASSGATGSSTALDSGNIVTTVATALLIGAGGVLGTRTFTPGASFAEREEIVQRLALEDRLVSSASTYTADMTISATDDWSMVGAAFIPEGNLVSMTPARMQWAAQSIRTPVTRTVTPGRLQWSAATPHVTMAAAPVTTVIMPARYTAGRRVAYAPVAGVSRELAQRQDLRLWYLAQSWQFPGLQWLDLVAGVRGTFLNMPHNDSLAGWQPQSHPGGRGAVGFDGSGRAVTLDPSPRFSNLDQLTLSAWIYPRSFGTASKSRILDQTGIAASGGFYLGVNTIDAVTRAVEFGVDGATLLIALSANSVIDVHTWTHVAVVWTGSFLRSTVQFYINGVAVSTQTGAIGQDGGAPLNDGSFNPLYLGNRDALDRGFDGLLNDIRVYATPLIPAEVEAVYLDSLRGSPALLQQPRMPLMLTPGPAHIPVPPARMQWRAQTLALGLAVVVQPAALAWARGVPIVQGGAAHRTILLPYATTRGRSQTIRGADINRAETTAVQFLGSGGGLTGTANLPPITACTLMAWVRLGENAAFAPALAYGPAASASYYAVGVAANGVNLALYNGLSGPVSGSVLGKGVWRHLALVVEAPDRIVAYLDGEEDAERTDDPAAVGEAINIGRSPDNVFFQGDIASIKVYGRGMSRDELHLEMRYANPVSRDGLLIWLPIRDRVVASAGQDYSGYKADMVVVGNPLITTGPPLRWNPIYLRRQLIPLEITEAGSVGDTPVTVTPSRLQWRAQILSLTRTAVAIPAQMQWRAQVPAVAGVKQVSPAQLKWQANAGLLTRSMVIASARMQWQAQTLTQTGTVRVTPAMVQWQAQTPGVTRAFLTTPARMQWQASMSVFGENAIPALLAFTAVNPMRQSWRRKPPLGTTLDRAYPLAQGLEACWLFNEREGAFAYDLSGNGHHIALNAATGTRERWGGGALHGGALEFVSPAGALPAAGNIVVPIRSAATVPRSIEFWLTATSTGADQALVATDALRGIYLSHSTSSTFNVVYTGDGGGMTSTSLPYKTLHHLVFSLQTVLGSGMVLSFYVNGRLHATAAITEATEEVLLGFGNFVPFSLPFVGTMDLVRIWTRSLSAEEVFALYTRPFDMCVLKPTLAHHETAPLIIRPAQLQWQTLAPRYANRTIRIEPAQLQWQVQLLMLSGTLRAVEPTQMQWRITTATASAGSIENRYAHSPGMFPVPQTWHRKPPLGTRIDHLHPLARGLEACWLLNEGQGNRAYDNTGRGHTLTFGQDATAGTLVTWRAAAEHPNFRGGAALFGETAGSLPLNTSNLDVPVVLGGERTDFTVEMWIAPTMGATTNPGRILANAIANEEEIIILDEGALGWQVFWFDFAGSLLSNVRYPWDKMHHVVVARRAIDTELAQLFIIVDGVEILNASRPVRAAIRWTRIGNNQNSKDYHGGMGLLRIWSRALGLEEIASLYASPFAMFDHHPTLLRFGRPPSPPAQMQWRAQATIHANRTVVIRPAQMPWVVHAQRFTGTLTGGVVPAQMRWQAKVVDRTIDVVPARMKWRSPQQRLPIGLNLRDCGDAYEAALQRTMIGGDWLIQAPDIGLKVSFNYEAGGGWEHRIVDISDIEISAPPGGGITSAANVTVTIAENQRGQSILELWEQASAVEAVEVTIDFILNGETSALRIFTGRIDSIVVKDALAQILLVDDSISKNLLVPQEVVTADNYPNADQGVLTKAIPLVYGQGALIGASPLLFVDVTTNTYLVANHPMTLGGKLAVYDQPTKTFLTLDAIVFIPNNGNASITLGTLNNGVLTVTDPGTTTAPEAAIDGNSATAALTPTTIAGTGFDYDSAIQIGDGWGYATWGFRTPAFPQTTTFMVDITNHRRAPGSDPTTTGTFFIRGITAELTAETRKFFISPAFNHVTSAQHNRFIISNISIGINELLNVLLIARCQGTVGNASQVYHVGEISITPLIAFSATISGTPTAIGVPVNIQELRFNIQRPALSVYAATNVSQPTNVFDGNSLTLTKIYTSTLDSNLDGIGELIVTTTVTSAQRANNTVAIDLAKHRRGVSSDPTVTGTFAIQTYNTNTGVLLRDNLFVTQAFRHVLNPQTTSYVATAINLGATAQLAVRVVARNEGGAGNSLQYYEVGEIGVETFYQPRGDSGEVFLYGAGYEGRYDPDGTVTTYIGTSPGRLFQTPDAVIASIYVQELGLNIDLPSFATAYNYFAVIGSRFDGGIGAGWAVEQGNARDILDAMARQAASILFPTFSATWGIRPFRAGTAVHQEFTEDNILTEYGSESSRAEDRSSTMQLTLGNLQNVFNDIEVRYKYNVGSQKYDGVWRAAGHVGSNLPDAHPDKAAVEATCLSSFVRYGDLEPLILEANWIADDDTAANLLVHLVNYFSQQRITAQFETTFKAACLQVGDFITITDTSLPAGDNGNVFEVHAIRYMPMRGRIQLTASRVSSIPDVTIPDPPAALVGCERLVVPGMLACWDFEEASGSRTDHIAGVEMDELNGPILGVTGKVGNAIRFVQSSSQSLVNQNAFIGAFGGAFTIACWVRLQSVPAGFWAIVSNEASTGYPKREIWFGVAATGTIHVGVGHSNLGGSITTVAALPFTGTAADWTLIRCWRTCDSSYSGTLSVQINNGSVETAVFTGAVPIAYNQFRIGAGFPAGVLGYFPDFDLDQLQIYNRVLNQDELDAIWNGGLG